MNFRLAAVELVARPRSRVSIVKITLSVRTVAQEFLFGIFFRGSLRPTHLISNLTKDWHPLSHRLGETTFFPYDYSNPLVRSFLSPCLADTPTSPRKKSKRSSWPFSRSLFRSFFTSSPSPHLVSAGSGSSYSFRQLRLCPTHLKPAVLESTFAIPRCLSRSFCGGIIQLCSFPFELYLNLCFIQYI